MVAQVELLDRMMGLGEQEICLFDRYGSIVYNSSPFHDFLKKIEPCYEEEKSKPTLFWLAKAVGISETPRYREIMDKIWCGESLHERMEYTVGDRLMSFSFIPMAYEEEVVTISLVMQDISTEFRKKSDFLMSTLVTHAPQPVALTSEDGEILRVNPAFCDLCGLSAEVLEGRHITTLVDLKMEELNAIEPDKSKSFYDKVMLLSNKRNFPVEVTAGSYHLEQATEALHYVLIYDLRSWQEKEVLKRRMTIMARQRDISADLHDSVAQNLALLQMKFEKIMAILGENVPPEAIKALVDYRQNVDTVQNEMRGIIRYLREESTVREEDCLWGIEEVLRYASQVLGLKIVDKGLANISVLDVNTQREIAQIIREVLTNVYKHAGVDKAWLTAIQKDDVLLVKVKDEGKGFDFHHVDEKSHYGLSILNDRIESLNGQMRVSSIKGKKTEVVFQIPFPSGAHQLKKEKKNGKS